jgi:hypothetical protein
MSPGWNARQKPSSLRLADRFLARPDLGDRDDEKWIPPGEVARQVCVVGERAVGVGAEDPEPAGPLPGGSQPDSAFAGQKHH